MKRLLLGLSAVSSFAIGSIIVLGSKKGVLNSAFRKSVDYSSCASIHFGMTDNTSTGYVSTYGTTYTEAKSPYASLGYAEGIEVSSVSISGASVQWLDEGTKYTVNKVNYTSDKVHGLKLGTSSKNSTLTYVFTQNVVGCDLYVKGWNDSNITVSVNDSSSLDVIKDSSISGTFNSKEVAYEKLEFNFEATDTLTISTTKRLFIGDIAIRVV